MKVKLLAVAVLFLVSAAIFVARMSHSINVLAQQTAYSQTITNQFGTYTNSVIISYDPNGGSGDGEAYVTEQLTGTPSSSMPGGVLHTPAGTVHLGGKCDIGNCTQTGSGVPANQSPNFSRTWSFDILADCDQQFLDNGFCIGDGETTDYCPIYGSFFLTFLHGIENEDAITNFLVPAHSQVGTKTLGTPESMPPDWVGLFRAPAVADVDLVYRAQTACFRVCRNPPCTGQLWICPGSAKKSKTIPATPLLNVTNKDKGFVTGVNVTF